jgi:predicted  nucleic acid-binding Zn-ribbon protein
MHNHEIGEMNNGYKELVVKFEKLSEAINNVMAEYKQIEYSVKKWEKKQQMVTDKVVRVEELQRKNILIFGLEDTTEAGAKFFKDTMRLEIA